MYAARPHLFCPWRLADGEECFDRLIRQRTPADGTPPAASIASIVIIASDGPAPQSSTASGHTAAAPNHPANLSVDASTTTTAAFTAVVLDISASRDGIGRRYTHPFGSVRRHLVCE